MTLNKGGSSLKGLGGTEGLVFKKCINREVESLFNCACGVVINKSKCGSRGRDDTANF